MSHFHYLVRGIYFMEGYVLLAHCLDADNTFLPGGHIRPGESAPDCLARELKEELALEAVKVGRFLGAVEHQWEDGTVPHYEINLLFQLLNLGIRPPMRPSSHETHLEFLWARPGELNHYNLEPHPLIEYLTKHLEDEQAFWGSTLSG